MKRYCMAALIAVMTVFAAVGCNSSSDSGNNYYNGGGGGDTYVRQILVGNYNDSSFTLINRETLEVSGTASTDAGSGLVGAVSSPDKVLTLTTNETAATKNVRIYNANQKKFVGYVDCYTIGEDGTVTEFAISAPKGIAVSPRANSYVFCGSGDGIFYKYNPLGNTANTGNWEFYTAPGNPQWAAYTTDNYHIYYTTDTKTVGKLDITSGETLHEQIPNAGDRGIAASTDEVAVWALSAATNSAPACLNKIMGTEVVATITDIGSDPYGVAYGVAGSHRAYVSNTGDNTVSVIDTANNIKVTDIAVGAGPTGIFADPDGTYVYVTNTNANTLSVIATASNTVVKTISVGSGPVCVTVPAK